MPKPLRSKDKNGEPVGTDPCIQSVAVSLRFQDKLGSTAAAQSECGADRKVRMDKFTHFS